jgi:hypothetical protein
MSRRLLAPMLALGMFALAVPIVAERAPAEADVTFRRFPSFSGLEPGAFVAHKQTVPVDIVLIGFDPSQINRSDLAALLPATSAPAVRYPQFYGLNGRDLGLEYEFKYSLTRKTRQFEDRFFRFLGSAAQPGSRIGFPGNPTVYMTNYNNQQKNLVNVTGPVLYIDGPSVERWLEHHANPRKDGYTLYFINWYGREDFRFHAYTKMGDPDPDTGVDFGNFQSSAIVSWGGSRSRSWFYDFSAGPEWNTTNWVVDTTDLNGDGGEEYRMPPIWEYATGGYRDAGALGYDMGLLARYVAIDLLFAPSPLYDPLVTAPAALGRKVADVTMFEDDPASSGLDFIDTTFARNSWEQFQPYYRWRAALRDVDPIDAGAKLSLDIIAGNSTDDGCWVPFGDPFAQLFCFFSEHFSDYVPSYPSRDYVAPVFAFNTTEAGLGDQFGLLGFADDNWVDGTQSFVFAFDADVYREVGYGFTATIIHEVGHHLGMSHPHDGFDPETGVDFGAEGEFYFTWAGGESETVMHYLTLSNQFGEHNRDNMYRWEAAGYLNWANALAGDILASPNAQSVFVKLVAADALAAVAKARLEKWDYLDAVERARAAYLTLVSAADDIGVSSARLAAARMRLPASQIRKYVCRPRQLVERVPQQKI